MRNILAFSVGCLFAFLLLETFLHFYQPFPVQVKQGGIVLPANRAFTFENTHIGKLDPFIVCTKNKLGFRGEERPAGFDEFISLVAVGGSTTECRLLNDGHDWPGLLAEALHRGFPGKKTWVNNAGLDGHSTFGHLILLENYLCQMHPDYILYLTGINEMDRDDLFSDDQAIVRSHSFSLTDWLKKNCETIVLANMLYRNIKARQLDLGHGNLDLAKLKIPAVRPGQIDSLFDAHRPYIAAYSQRLKSLVGKTKACGSSPILMTQPLLFGEGKDPLTGVDLEKSAAKFFNGATYWCLLEQYNDATREAALQAGVPLIDLARWMPKNSAYFYDAMHFTNEGAAVVSKIVQEELVKIWELKR